MGALAALSARPKKRVAVIGAGMGGLAAAIRLAAMGFEVEVFEKNDQVGGRVGRLEAEGFSFDTGPSLLLMTDTYRELFRIRRTRPGRLREAHTTRRQLPRNVR